MKDGYVLFQEQKCLFWKNNDELFYYSSKKTNFDLNEDHPVFLIFDQLIQNNFSLNSQS